jgi:peroxisomal 2,4-dienoyl-CoA reductase
LLIFDIKTQGVDRLLPSDVKQEAIKSQPLGRFGSVRDIADATVYLFSDSGSYVSGQVLVGMFSEAPLMDFFFFF